MPRLIENGTSTISSGQAVSQVKLWADEINIDSPVSHLAYVRIERTGCSVLRWLFFPPSTQAKREQRSATAEQSRGLIDMSSIRFANLICLLDEAKAQC